MAGEDPLPELVRDTELATNFHHNNTLTIHYKRWDRRKREYWHRNQRPIGSGGYGRVWLEQEVDSQGKPKESRLRAVKELSCSSTQRALKEYVRELEAIAKFSQEKYSDYFVRSLGWYQCPDSLYIAMEYCPCGDLKNHLAMNGAVGEADAQVIVSQILKGLAHMHEENFAHRDLKPANVLIVSKPPDDWVVKLSDFGLTKRAIESESTTVKGTFAYLPPELLDENARKTDHFAGDVWCIGETAFELMTAVTVFPHLSTRWKYTQDRTVFPAQEIYKAGASQQALDFITTAMAPIPSDRPSASEALKHAWMPEQDDPNDSPQIPNITVDWPTVPLLGSAPSGTATDEWTTALLPARDDSDIPEIGVPSSPSPSDATTRVNEADRSESPDSQRAAIIAKESSQQSPHKASPQEMSTVQDSSLDIPVLRSGHSGINTQGLPAIPTLDPGKGTSLQQIEPGASISGVGTTNLEEASEVPIRTVGSTGISVAKAMRVLPTGASDMDRQDGTPSIQPTVRLAERATPGTRNITPPEAERPQSSAAKVMSHVKSEEPALADPSIQDNGDPGTCHAIAMFDYERAEDNEVDLFKGKPVTSIEMVDEDWWIGTNHNGETGLFPSNYVKVVKAAEAISQIARNPASEATPSASLTATSLFAYEAAEDIEIGFPETAQITNLEFPDEDWWLGTYNGQSGLFPANYVQLNSAPNESSTSVVTGPSLQDEKRRSVSTLNAEEPVGRVPEGCMAISFDHCDDPTSSRMRPEFSRITRFLDSNGATLQLGRWNDGHDTSVRSSYVGFKTRVVSRKHATIRLATDGTWWLQDVKSSSGTYLNGVRLSGPGLWSDPHKLNDEDIIQLGVDYTEETESPIYGAVLMTVHFDYAGARVRNSKTGTPDSISSITAQAGGIRGGYWEKGMTTSPNGTMTPNGRAYFVPGSEHEKKVKPPSRGLGALWKMRLFGHP